MIGWVFFRAATFHDSLYVLHQMLFVPHGRSLIPAWRKVLALITLLLAVFEEKKDWFEKIALGPGLVLWSRLRDPAAFGGTHRLHASRRSFRLLSVLANGLKLYRFVDLEPAFVPGAHNMSGEFVLAVNGQIQRLVNPEVQDQQIVLLQIHQVPDTQRGPLQARVQPKARGADQVQNA